MNSTPDNQRVCINCGRPHFPTRKGRCKACDYYWHTYGIERPEVIFKSPVKGHFADRDGRSCPNCGVLFNPIKFYRREGKFLFAGQLRYCTRECGNAYRLRQAKGKPSKLRGKRLVKEPTSGFACRGCGILWTPIYYRRGRPIRLQRRLAARALCSDACRKIIRIQSEPQRLASVPRGPKHRFWKGGVGALYRRGLGWAKKTETVRRKQKYKCAECGKSESELGKVLDVHHKVPFHNFATARDANVFSNLVGLCRSCHAKADAAIVSRQLSLGLVLAGREFRPGKARGGRCASAKLTEAMVIEMRRRRADGATTSYLAKLFGVSPSVSQYACSGKTWKHVGGPLTSGRTYAKAVNPSG